MASCSSSPRTFRHGEAPAAPPPPHPLCPSPWSGNQHKFRGSTVQVNLKRIISIISTALPPQPHPFNAFQYQLAPPPSLLSPPPLETAGITESRIHSTPSNVEEGLPVDLRLRLGPPWEIARLGSPDEKDQDLDTGLLSSACSVTGKATTKVTEGGGGMAAPETAESGIVSVSNDGANGWMMFNANSSEATSSEGEWNAVGKHRGGAEHEKVKKARVQQGGGGEEKEREGRPYSEITSHRGDTNGGAEEGDITQRGFLVKEDVGMEKKTSKTNGDDQREGERRCTRREEGYLGLLLEAVQRVSGGSFGEDEVECPRMGDYGEEGRADEPAGRSKEGRGWEAAGARAFDVYEVVGVEKPTLGPVVRSKRGRSQALPSRYRDSVLEPWRKQSGSGGQHRHLQRRQTRTAR